MQSSAVLPSCEPYLLHFQPAKPEVPTGTSMAWLLEGPTGFFPTGGHWHRKEVMAGTRHLVNGLWMTWQVVGPEGEPTAK